MAKDTADKADKNDDEKKGAAEKEREDAPFGYDLLGSDGRHIYRGVPLATANDENGRISSMTGEKLTVQPSEAPAGDSKIEPMPEPKKDFPAGGGSSTAP